MERTIFLVRHGRPDFPDDRLRFLGRTDLSLSEEGIDQARKLAPVFAGHNLNRVFHSGMKRTSQTASFIFENAPRDMTIAPELMEIAFGKWENLTLEEISERSPGTFEARNRDLAGFRPPEGESFKDAQDRAYPAFLKILDSTEGDIMIVGHAGVFKSIIVKILGIPLGQLFSFRLDYCGVTVLTKYDEYLSVRRLNWTPLI